jgi:hypothetical protein
VRLSIIETLVVFAGIPLAVVAVITGLIYAGGARSNDRRYRPGRPFDFTPVWFLSAPDHQSPNSHALPAAEQRALITHGAGGAAAEGRPIAGAEGRPSTTGGASDRW